MQFDADLPLTKVASLTGLREHTVRRTLSALRDAGAVRRVTMVNWFTLGLTAYVVNLSLASQTAAERSRFLKELTRHDAIGWVREGGGALRYEFIIVVHSAAHARSVLGEILETARVQIGKSYYSEELRWFVFKRGYLPRVIQPSRMLTFEPKAEIVEIDEVDWRIIHAVTKRSLFTIRELAQQVGIPSATAEYRLKTLKKKGVILASILDLHLPYFGIQHYRIALRISRISDEITERLVQFGKSQSNVIALVSLFGAWDYAMRIEVPDTEALGEVLGALHEMLGAELRQTLLTPVITTPKQSASAAPRRARPR